MFWISAENSVYNVLVTAEQCSAVQLPVVYVLHWITLVCMATIRMDKSVQTQGDMKGNICCLCV